MQWTTEQPTQDGLYLAYKGEKVEYVDVFGGLAYRLGDNLGLPCWLHEFTHWMGPLPVPGPPKE